MTDKFFVSLSPQCLSSDLEHRSTSSDDSKTDKDDDNVPLAQVANKVSFIILEIMSNETRQKINVFTFLVACFGTEEDDVNLKDKHTQGKFVRETSAKDIKKCSCFPFIVKGNITN